MSRKNKEDQEEAVDQAQDDAEDNTAERLAALETRVAWLEEMLGKTESRMVEVAQRVHKTGE